MKKLTALLIIAAGWTGLSPADAATVSRIKAVSRLPGATPPLQAEVQILNASAVSGTWRVTPIGTYQADVLFSGSGGVSLTTVDFGVRPSGRSFNLEARAVNTRTGGTIEDSAACGFELSRSSITFPAGGGVGTVSVAADVISGAQVQCAWTAVDNADWISILSGSEGVGSGSVVYRVQPNPCGARRQASVVAAGLTLTVVQEADIPTVTISPVTRTHDAKASTGHQISVQDDCGLGWAASTSAGWVHITSGSSGSGSGTVVYRVDDNTSIRPRTATVSIPPGSFTVIQEGKPCSYDLTRGASPPIFFPEGGAGCLSLTAPDGCPWTAAAGCTWVKIQPGSGAGTGSGTICIDVAENLTTNSRSCTVYAGGESYAVQQAAGRCQYGLSPSPAFFEFPNWGGENCVEVLATSGCVWTAENQDPDWIQLTSADAGEGNGTLCFSVTENTNVEARTGTILVKNQVITVRQVSGCTSPCGSDLITERRPAITWCPVEGATWHELFISWNGQTYLSQWIEQTSSEYIPEQPLPCGAYEWWVRSWGPEAGMGAWNASCSFRIEDCCTPGELAGPSPVGTCEEAGRVTYTWESDPCATWYRLWVGKDGQTFRDQWYETGLMPSGTVSLTVFDHGFGLYGWYVVGWGPDGTGKWSGPFEFVVGAAVPVAPLGQVGSPIALAWDDSCSAQAAWYQFWVARDGQTYWTQWVPAGDTHPGAPGERWLGPLNWPAGRYAWWLRAWMPGGMGPWTAGAEFVIE